MNLSHLIAQQDIVLKISFAILLLMSILSWSIMLIRFIYAWRQKGLNQKIKQQFFQATDWEQLTHQCQGKPALLAHIILEAIQGAKRYQDHNENLGLAASLPYKEFLHLHIQNSLNKYSRAFDGGLTTLASIGAVAPFIGLFGTVWGIFNALMDISTQGQVSISTISAPIGEALVATAMGLFVAIPAVLGYNAISRINRNFQQGFNEFAHNLYIYLLNAKEK